MKNASNVLSVTMFVLLFALALSVWFYMADRAGWFDPIAPDGWGRAANRNDILKIPDYKVAYWGKPDAQYSIYATRGRRPPRAIVVHFNYPKSLYALVKYGHAQDFSRGGGSFGYHFYIGRSGKVVQGAPLSVRTNHIKSARKPQRTAIARHLWSGNTIGVSLVGACNPLRSPKWGNWKRCARETPSPEQLEAGLAVVRALQTRFNLECAEVYGHGDLQTDRDTFEGRTLSRLARDLCAEATETVTPLKPQATTDQSG
ncbi:MAG: peptidoglycan recognition family protein [Pseudomonadota bacterium]